jgi:excisionase family DNA binding protein
MPKNLFTPEEIAAVLGKNIHTIYQHLRAGKLPSTKPGGSYIITRADLAQYLGGKERVDSLFGEAE